LPELCCLFRLPISLESSSEIVRLKRDFIQAAGSANSPVAILTC
jgi:hypothetical protein